MPEDSRGGSQSGEEPTRHDVAEDRRIRFRATLLLALTAALVLAFAAYVMYARGTFEDTQRLVLMASNSEGISVGADLTFSGFPVGRVERIDLAPNGQARIEIDVPRKDARWLRAGSVFTLERGLVGGARLRAFTGDLDDAPLPDGAVRPVLRGDTTDELPALIANVNRVLGNIERLTSEGSGLDTSLSAARSLLERMQGRHGALSVVLGGDEQAARAIVAIERANRLLESLDRLARSAEALTRKADATLGKADARVFGAGGMADEAHKAAQSASALLADARQSLRKVDAMLVDAQRIAADTRGATGDLAALRAEVEATLRRIGSMIEEIDRKWPFRRETELTLP